VLHLTREEFEHDSLPLRRLQSPHHETVQALGQRLSTASRGIEALRDRDAHRASATPTIETSGARIFTG
jgi:hypothetical protein